MSKIKVRITVSKPGVQEKAVTLFAMMVDSVIDLKAKPGQWCCISVSGLKEALDLEKSKEWFDIVVKAAEIVCGAPLKKVGDGYISSGKLAGAFNLDDKVGLGFEVTHNLVAISRGLLLRNEVAK